jgi:hypothetical protein
MVEETFEPGMTVSLVARRHGVAPNATGLPTKPSTLEDIRFYQALER